MQFRSSPRTIGALAIAVLLSLLVVVCPSHSEARENPVPPELQHVGVSEHLDGQVPLATKFRDHTGEEVRLGDYFDGKRPVVLGFAYHSCPVLCSMVLNATINGLRGIGWTIGKDFDVVTISIDPKDGDSPQGLERTAAKRAKVIEAYGRDTESAQRGWHFLVGDQASINAATNAIGFEYQYDERQQQYGHPSVIMLLKPNGQVARYLYGLQFESNDLKVGLLEASEGRSISTVEKIILFCYHYDPQGGRYVLVANRVMQVGGVLTAIALGSFLALMWMRERRRSKRESLSPGPLPQVKQVKA